MTEDDCGGRHKNRKESGCNSRGGIINLRAGGNPGGGTELWDNLPKAVIFKKKITEKKEARLRTVLKNKKGQNCVEREDGRAVEGRREKKEPRRGAKLAKRTSRKKLNQT